MQDPAKQKKLYKLLAILFAVGGFIWFIGGFFSVPRHYILFPLIGIVHWGVAWHCKQTAERM